MKVYSKEDIEHMLAPCPFCGSSAIRFAEYYGYISLSCQGCGCYFIRRAREGSKDSEAVEKIIEKWNSRVKDVSEWCPHCENETVMDWDTDKNEVKAYCPYCGEMMMFCSECDEECCVFDIESGKCCKNKSL